MRGDADDGDEGSLRLLVGHGALPAGVVGPRGVAGRGQVVGDHVLVAVLGTIGALICDTRPKQISQQATRIRRVAQNLSRRTKNSGGSRVWPHDRAISFFTQYIYRPSKKENKVGASIAGEGQSTNEWSLHSSGCDLGEKHRLTVGEYRGEEHP